MALARLHLRRHRATPCQDCFAEEEGAARRGQELPAPAWAGRHTGRNVPSSAGPPSACHPPHPGMAECKPGASGECPEQTAGTPTGSAPCCVQTGPVCTGLEHGDPRPSQEGGTAYLGSPSSWPSLTPGPDTCLGEAPSCRPWAQSYGQRRCSLYLLLACTPPSGARQTPRAARTHRLAPSPPPLPEHLSPGMPWEVERAGPCRRSAVPLD